MRARHEAGFTLLEMLIVVVTFGLVMIAAAPLWDSLQSNKRRAYDEKQKLSNLALKGALESYAAASILGRLPAPSTGSAVFDPTNNTPEGLALASAIAKTSLGPDEINSDGNAAHNVRVYQLVQDLTISMPLEFRSGPVVTLTYDYGAVYMTSCPLADNTCNPTPATGIPGTSSVLTAANFSTWSTQGTDTPAAFTTSLPIQEAMLATTAQRLNRVRDALLTYVRGLQVTATAGAETNWFPNQLGASAAGSLTGATPGPNAGCRDGWYDLSPSGHPTILAIAGLAASEFGVTAWGGAVQYCRDFDPTGSSGANAAPHYGALRIHSNVSAGTAPDAAVPGNNVVLTIGG